jgi:hypothetical protein
LKNWPLIDKLFYLITTTAITTITTFITTVKLNTTFCASFVFWERLFQYFVEFESKFAESFFLKSIIYYPGGK